MKTKTIKVYTLDELSQEAQEKAYNKWLEHHEYYWADENTDTLKEFEKAFRISLKNWSIGDRSEGVSFDTAREYKEENELTGARLMAYLWNNYGHLIARPKYYGHLRLTDSPIRHKRIKSTEIKQGPNAGKFSNSYYSGCTRQQQNCNLTGYCMDDSILDPIHEFLKGKTPSWKYQNFKDLMGYCFDSWVKACNADYEYSTSFEAFKEDAKANEYEYTITGARA